MGRAPSEEEIAWLILWVARQAHLRRLATGHLPAAAAQAVAASSAAEAAVQGETSSGPLQLRAGSLASSRQPSPAAANAVEAAAAAASAAAARTSDAVKLNRTSRSSSVRCVSLPSNCQALCRYNLVLPSALGTCIGYFVSICCRQ